MKSRVSDSMYSHNDHYYKFCILRSIVLTIQKVCINSTFYTSTSEALWWNYYIVKKRLLCFQNDHLYVFNDKQSTRYHKNILVWWMKCSGHGDYVSGDVVKTGDKSALREFFVVKRVLNRIWNWLIVFRGKLEFTQMVFDSWLQLRDLWNTAYNRGRKQEHFWIILWRAHELLKGKSKKTIPVMWQYSCLQWVLTV